MTFHLLREITACHHTGPVARTVDGSIFHRASPFDVDESKTRSYTTTGRGSSLTCRAHPRNRKRLSSALAPLCVITWYYDNRAPLVGGSILVSCFAALRR